jgi:hypothetical protein
MRQFDDDLGATIFNIHSAARLKTPKFRAFNVFFTAARGASDGQRGCKRQRL